MSVDDARRVIGGAIDSRVFPAAAVDVGDSESALWTEALGTLSFDRPSAPTALDTPFDLASLTKVVATTTILMELVRTGALRLDEPVSAVSADWRGADRAPVTVRDLLEHASGLPARLFDAPPAGRREFEHEIGAIPLEYVPRTRSIYSDLGFILLAFLAVDRGGAPLAELFAQIMVRLQADRGPGSVWLQPPFDAAQGGPEALEGPDLVTFDLSADVRRLAAPTRPMDDDNRRGRALAGEVHDNYAAALGGAAGHAGLFGTAPGVGAFARAVLRASRGYRGVAPPFSPELVSLFTTKTTVPGSSRALGWDTMLPTSSCGSRLSPRAFGHVGFTGTSLWIDPVRDRYFVLLTNRVNGGGTLDDIRAVRRAFHDALGDL